MVERVIQEGIGNVVVLFLDRFGRHPREILRRYWELQERGITVRSINEDLQEELMLLLRAGIAGQERTNPISFPMPTDRLSWSSL